MEELILLNVLDQKIKTISYTITALIAFAANSVFCRIALKDDAIDASSFTAIRLLSGVAMFLILLSFSSHSLKQPSSNQRKTWISAFMLFLYAITFSFAYISLETGTGALVLFGAVQITMVTMSVISGHRIPNDYNTKFFWFYPYGCIRCGMGRIYFNWEKFNRSTKRYSFEL